MRPRKRCRHMMGVLIDGRAFQCQREDDGHTNHSWCLQYEEKIAMAFNNDWRERLIDEIMTTAEHEITRTSIAKMVDRLCPFTRDTIYTPVKTDIGLMYDILTAGNARHSTHVNEDRTTRIMVCGVRHKSPYRCGNVELYFDTQGRFIKAVGYNDDVPELDTVWRRFKYVLFGMHP